MKGLGFKLTLCAFVAAAMSGLLAAVPLQAAEDSWKAAVSGGWDTNSRWLDGAAPTSQDLATFNLAGTYLGTFPIEPSPILALKLINAANITFGITSGSPQATTLRVDLEGVRVAGGATLTLGRAAGLPLHLTSAYGVSLETATILNVKFGSDVNANSFVQNNGQLNVTNSGSTITAPTFRSEGAVDVMLGGLIQNVNGSTAAT